MNRYQVVSSLMAFVAVFLVITSFNYLKINLLEQGPNEESGNLSFKVDEDWDNDGLNNREESYWNTDPNDPDTDDDGYLDGEEVASKHDPLIPGPDDLINTGNLTEKFSELTLAGLHEGSLKSDSPDYVKSLNILTSAITEDAESGFEKNPSSFNIKTTSSDRGSQESYVRIFSELFKDLSVAYFDEMYNLEKSLNIIGNTGFSDPNVTNYFNSKTLELQNIFNRASGVSVPENWRQSHLSFLKTASILTEINRSLGSPSGDPIKATAALNKLAGYLDILPQMAQSYLDIIDKKKLNVESTIFER